MVAVMRRVVLFVVAATLILTPLDLFQVVMGVRTLGTDPWLTPAKFAAVGLVLGLLSWHLDPDPHPSGKLAVLVHGTFFVLGYAATAIDAPGTNTFLLVMFVISLLLQADWSHGSGVSTREVFPFLVLLFIAGPAVEAIDVKMGGFRYTHARLIPDWLPFLWASGAFLVRSLIGITRS
jgi:hypothetical protein